MNVAPGWPPTHRQSSLDAAAKPPCAAGKAHGDRGEHDTVAICRYVQSRAGLVTLSHSDSPWLTVPLRTGSQWQDFAVRHQYSGVHVNLIHKELT
jgi:hypothetical protein